MTIELKVAHSDIEVDHALWVRHEVFVIEDGKFGGKPLPGERVLDRFDAFPGVHNIVAYEGDEAIATIRLVRETALGLPAQEYYDFEGYRAAAREELRAAEGGAVREPVLGSAGMLAVRKPWRARRDVVRAMFKVAAGVSLRSGVSHIVLAVNHETVGMYRRLGFRALSDKIWVEEIGNFVVPLATSVHTFYGWAFGDLPKSPLDTFKDDFERVFLRAEEVLFTEGDAGDKAYIVNDGIMRISRTSPYGESLNLANLSRGDLFGELALIDEGMRSATAVAATDVELISLDREAFMEGIHKDPRQIHALLAVFAQRLRQMDDFAMVLAYSSEEKQLQFAVHLARSQAKPDRKHHHRIYRGSAEDIASMAAVSAERALAFLDGLETRGEVQCSARQIRFLR